MSRKRPRPLAVAQRGPIHRADTRAQGGTRRREWRIEPSVALSRVPELRMDYRPEAWLLLTHGRAPFVVAAGTQGDVPKDRHG